MWAKIVMNLLSNALKFTFTGGITVRLYATDGDVELTVTDTGIGIDPADQERLFERFHRVIGAPLAQPRGHGHRASRSSPSWPSCTAAPRRVRVHAGRGLDVHGHDPVRRRAPAGRPGRQRPGPRRPPQRYAEGFVAEAMRWLDPGDGAAAHATPPAGERPRVLVVDDNADMRYYIASLLAGRYAVRDRARRRGRAGARARASRPSSS